MWDTRDHSLKLCGYFPASLLFLWQSICRVVRELKSCHQVTFPSQLNGRYCMNKKKRDKRSFSLFGQFHRMKKKKKKKKKKKERQTFMAHYYSVSSGRICQNRIAGIGPFNLSRSHPFFLSWLCLGYLFPLNVSW